MGIGYEIKGAIHERGFESFEVTVTTTAIKGAPKGLRPDIRTFKAMDRSEAEEICLRIMGDEHSDITARGDRIVRMIDWESEG